MSTTSKKEEIPEWGKWGDGKKEPKMKEYLELLMKYNTQAIEVMKEAKEIHNVEKVIPTIYLVSELSRNKNY